MFRRVQNLCRYARAGTTNREFQDWPKVLHIFSHLPRISGRLVVHAVGGGFDDGVLDVDGKLQAVLSLVRVCSFDTKSSTLVNRRCCAAFTTCALPDAHTHIHTQWRQLVLSGCVSEVGLCGWDIPRAAIDTLKHCSTLRRFAFSAWYRIDCDEYIEAVTSAGATVPVTHLLVENILNDPEGWEPLANCVSRCLLAPTSHVVVLRLELEEDCTVDLEQILDVLDFAFVLGAVAERAHQGRPCENVTFVTGERVAARVRTVAAALGIGEVVHCDDEILAAFVHIT